MAPFNIMSYVSSMKKKVISPITEVGLSSDFLCMYNYIFNGRSFPWIPKFEQ